MAETYSWNGYDNINTAEPPPVSDYEIDAVQTNLSKPYNCTLKISCVTTHFIYKAFLRISRGATQISALQFMLINTREKQTAF